MTIERLIVRKISVIVVDGDDAEVAAHLLGTALDELLKLAVA